MRTIQLKESEFVYIVEALRDQIMCNEEHMYDLEDEDREALQKDNEILEALIKKLGA